jgi:iron complex outermembrane receptor protein
MYTGMRALRAAMMTAVSTIVLAGLAVDDAMAQANDLGSVTVAGAPKPAPRRAAPRVRRPATAARPSRPVARRPAVAPVVAATSPSASSAPIVSDRAIGSGAPAGSAPALAPSQGSLRSAQPMSVVSDKVLKDVIPASSDYNEAAKYTPGFVSVNSNGVGDSKSGWRGFQDGQFNITFDGIPFGDANDPTHHSAAYFPASFLSRVTVDRGPGDASQVGYAPFGGTLGLWSLQLSDKAGASAQMSYGNYNTFTTSVSGQSGKTLGGDTRALVSVSAIHTNGIIQYGDSQTYQGLIKVDTKFGDLKVTALATGGTERYNNINTITWPQYLAHGVNYGQVNGNPSSTQYYGFNNSLKATDMEYVRLEGDAAGFKVDNTTYTYSYWYPRDQLNGVDQSIEGNASIANKGTLTKVTFPQGGTAYTYPVPNGDVTGYNKVNNYRAFGDILRISRDFNGGFFNGQLRTGVWYEHVGNERSQQYADYTTGLTYAQLSNTIPVNASYKLSLTSYITNVQPFVEYEWRPTDRLTITPGYKFESFSRDHEAVVNQTTLLPMDYSKTYTASLPFLTARYLIMPNLSVYAQASKGFLAPTVSAYYVLNPGLNSIEPQQTTNYQVGAVYKTNDFTMSASLYQITATNFPITNTVNGLTYYQNGGTARYQGAELEGTYAIGNGLAAYASGALIGAKFTDGANKGLRVGGAPSYTLAGGLVYDDQRFFGSLLHKIVGDQYGSSGQKFSTATTDGTLNKIGSYNTTDFVAGIRTDVLKRMGFGERAEFKVGVNNIFDHRNITSISGDPTGLTSINNTTLAYGFLPARTFYAAAKIDF